MIIEIGLGLSLIVNIFLVYKHFTRPKNVQVTKDANGVINDLTIQGHSIVKVTRLDPNDFLLRSPYKR